MTCTVYRILVTLSMLFWILLSAAGIAITLDVEGADDLLIAASFPAAVSTVCVGALNVARKEGSKQ